LLFLIIGNTDVLFISDQTLKRCCRFMRRNSKKCQNSRNSETFARRSNCQEAKMLTKWRQV